MSGVLPFVSERESIRANDPVCDLTRWRHRHDSDDGGSDGWCVLPPGEGADTLAGDLRGCNRRYRTCDATACDVLQLVCGRPVK